MYISQIGAINNSAYAMMQSSNSMMSLTRNASGSSTGALQAQEKNLMMGKLSNELIYQASSAMEDSQKKVEDENIRRSFSTFA